MSRVLRHRVEHLVLHLGEEQGSRLGIVPVVDREREEVAHLLVEALLRRADVADALEQLVEVIPVGRILQALVVHDEALHEVFAQVRRGPLAELRAARRPHAIADRQDHVEVVELHGAPHSAVALGLNCQVILDGCRGGQLPFDQHVAHVQADVLFGGLEQFGEFDLVQPDGATFRAQEDPGLTILGGVDQQFGIASR